MENDHLLEAISGLRTELLGRMNEQAVEQRNLKTELLIRVNEQRAELIDHIHGVGAGLHTQIEDLDKRFGERFDRIEKRMELQAGLVQSGARALARFTEWSEATDLDLSRYDRRLTEIEKRLSNLEKSA
jgi:hypothetical protein